MNQVLLVALGGALGSAARYGVNIGVAHAWGGGYPLHTLLVNALGCFLMGLLAGLGADAVPLPEPLRLLLAVGLLGGFTTFSAFSLDTLLLVERGEVAAAVGYVFFTVMLSLLGVFAGVAAGKMLA